MLWNILTIWQWLSFIEYYIYANVIILLIILLIIRTLLCAVLMQSSIKERQLLHSGVFWGIGPCPFVSVLQWYSFNCQWWSCFHSSTRVTGFPIWPHIMFAVFGVHASGGGLAFGRDVHKQNWPSDNWGPGGSIKAVHRMPLNYPNISHFVGSRISW